jgi:hypothetical protein
MKYFERRGFLGRISNISYKYKSVDRWGIYPIAPKKTGQNQQKLARSPLVKRKRSGNQSINNESNRD